MKEYFEFLRKSSPVMLLLFSSMYTTMQMFIYLPWMVQHLIPGLDEKDIGNYSGFIGMSQFLGRAISGYLWGYIADRFGWKIVLIVSGIPLAFSTLGFGFSVVIEMAIIFRFSVGFANGITPIAKAVMSEFSSESTHSFAMGFISAISSLSFVVSTGLSGFLADPIMQYDIRPIWILSKFPYSLPGIFNAILIIIGVISVCIFMKNGHSKKEETLNIETESEINDECNQVLLPVESENRIRRYIRSSTLYQLITNRYTMLAIFINAVFHVVVTSFEEVIPLWFKLSTEFGGFEMSMKTSSIIILVSAFISVPFSMFLFKGIERCLSRIRTFLLLLSMLIPCLIILPVVSFIENEFIAGACLSTLLIAIRALMSGITTGISIFINNSVTSDKLGAVNGLSSSVCSVFRGIATVYGGVVFSSSLGNAHFPFNYNLIFIINSGVLILCIILGSALPESINEKIVKNSRV